MDTKYTQVTVNEETDPRSQILSMLTENKPYVLLTVEFIDGFDEGMNVKMETGGGITAPDTVRALLNRVLEALPPSSEG